MNHPFTYMLLFVIFSLGCVSFTYFVGNNLIRFYINVAHKNNRSLPPFDKFLISFSVYGTFGCMAIGIGSMFFRKVVVLLGVI